MMDETNQSPFFQDLNEIYKERELLFKERAGLFEAENSIN